MIKGIKIEIIQFHLTQLLLIVLEKIKGSQVIDIGIYLRDIQSVTSPPDKLCYVLIV